MEWSLRDYEQFKFINHVPLLNALPNLLRSVVYACKLQKYKLSEDALTLIYIRADNLPVLIYLKNTLLKGIN